MIEKISEVQKSAKYPTKKEKSNEDHKNNDNFSQNRGDFMKALINGRKQAKPIEKSLKSQTTKTEEQLLIAYEKAKTERTIANRRIQGLTRE